MKRLPLILAASLTALVLALWLHSWIAGFHTVTTSALYTRQIASTNGTLSIITFSTEAEDDYYHIQRIHWWAISIAPCALTVLLSAKLLLSRRKNLRGFPVTPTDASSAVMP